MMIDGVEHVPMHVARNSCNANVRQCGFFDRPGHEICSHPERDDDTKFGVPFCSQPPRIWVPITEVQDMVKARLTS